MTTRDPEDAQTVGIAERILDLTQLRRALQFHARSAPRHGESESLAGSAADDALHVRETLNLGSIDPGHHVADLKTGRGRGAVCLDLVDPSRRARLAEEREHESEDHDRKKKIGDRARGDDCGARSDLLVMETQGAFLGRHVLQHLGRRRRGLGIVAEELHIAAQGNRGNLPARALAVVEPNEFRSESQRERQYFHAGPAANQEVTEFVKEDNDGEDEQEGDQIADKAVAQRIETMKKKFGHPIPLNPGRRPCPDPL